MRHIRIMNALSEEEWRSESSEQDSKKRATKSGRNFRPLRTRALIRSRRGHALCHVRPKKGAMSLSPSGLEETPHSGEVNSFLRTVADCRPLASP